MPCAVTWQTRGVQQRLFGYVTAREYAESVDAIQRDARFDDLRYIVVDCTGITGDDFDEDKLAEIATLGHVAHLSNVACPVAFVITAERIAALIRKLFVEALRDVMDIAVVATHEQAHAWFDSLAQPRPHNLLLRTS